MRVRDEGIIDSSRLGEIRKRLGENLPEGWGLTTLGEVFKWGSGGTPQRTVPRFYGGNIPWLIIGDLNDGIVIDSESTITEDGLRESSAKWVESGSVLLAMYGSIGKLGIAGRRLTTNQAIAFTMPDPVNAKYLFYYLMYTRGDLASLGKGATQKNISQTVIKAFPFVLAPQDQQTRIVTEIEKQFSRLDEADANLKRVKANLKRYKAAVLKAAVEGKLTEESRRQHPDVEPADKLLERILAERRKAAGKGKYKEPVGPDTSGLPELPVGWVWASVEQVGQATTGFTPPTGKSEFFGGDIPFFKPTDLDAGYYTVNAREWLTEAGANCGRLLPAKSILVTCIGATIGKTGFARVPCATNQQINALSVFDGHIVPEFLFWFFVSPEGQRQVIENSSATTLPILNKSKFEGLSVPLPPLAEQHKVVAEVERRLSIVAEAEAEVDKNLRRADRLRQSILKQAYSGKLVANSGGE